MNHRRDGMLLISIALALFIAGCGGEDGSAGNPSERQGTPRRARRDSSADNSRGRGTIRRKPFDVFAGQHESSIVVQAVDRPPPKSAAAALAALETIRRTYERENIPDGLKPPLTPVSTRNFLEVIKFLSEQRIQDVDWLEKIEAGTLTDDMFEALSLKNAVDEVLLRLQDSVKKALDDAKHGSRRNLDSFLKNDVQLILQGANADANAEYIVKQVLTDPPQMKRRDEAVARVARLFLLAVMFDEQPGLQPAWPSIEDDKWPSKTELREAVARYRRKLHKAVAAVRPPQAAGGAELTKIAGRVLTDAQYQLPQARQIIVTDRKRPLERSEHLLVDGAVTQVQSRWDQFQAATIERTGDGDFAIFYHDMLFYRAGPPGVPLEQWILGRRFQSAPVLKKYIESR